MGSTVAMPLVTVTLTVKKQSGCMYGWYRYCQFNEFLQLPVLASLHKMAAPTEKEETWANRWAQISPSDNAAQVSNDLWYRKQNTNCDWSCNVAVLRLQDRIWANQRHVQQHAHIPVMERRAEYSSYLPRQRSRF